MRGLLLLVGILLLALPRLMAVEALDEALAGIDARTSITEERILREYRRLTQLHGEDPGWSEDIRTAFSTFRTAERVRLVDALGTFSDDVADPEAKAHVLMRCAFWAPQAGLDATPFEQAATAVAPAGRERAKILELRLGRADTAQEEILLRQALAEDPTRFDLTDRLIASLWSQARWSEVIPWAAARRDAGPGDAGLRRLAIASLRAGRFAEAEATARSGFHHDPPPRDAAPAVLIAAAACLGQGRTDEAEALITACPPSAEVLEHATYLTPEAQTQVRTWATRAIKAAKANTTPARNWGIDAPNPAEEDAAAARRAAKAEAQRQAAAAARAQRQAQDLAAAEAARCPTCAGAGRGLVICPICTGSRLESSWSATGEVRHATTVEGAYRRYSTWRERKACRTCEGEGAVVRPCDTCHGSGTR